ncbi:MAG: LysM peptidoglycan-binding domain-containing protein [Actinomycetota bacterium]
MGTAAALWAAAPAAHAGSHLVRDGETLSGIAARYGTSPTALAQANNLSDPNFIVAGRRLQIPARLTMNVSYTVRSGDTLSGIALRYDTTPQSLARANRLSDRNFIVAGTTLKVPGIGSSSGASTSGATGASYTVRRGDTLSDIALRHNTTATALARANNLSNPSYIVAGSSLRVPGVTTSSPVSAPAPVSTTEIASSLENHAAAHGVDSSLVKAVAYHESGWQQDVVSSAGALGVMQVMPATGDFVNEVLGGHTLDIRGSADDNIHAGVMYLRHMLAVMPTVDRALAAYFSGPGNVGHRLNRHQRAYVASVQALRIRY